MSIKYKFMKKLAIVLLFSTFLVFIAPIPNKVYAGTICGGGGIHPSVPTAIDIGCQGKGNPIMDLTFALVRLLSDGVGLIVIASLVVAGLQYTLAGGNPQSTQKAKTRIRSAITALVLYIFIYAIINYLVPGGFLN